jgi:hypothetical protein
MKTITKLTNNIDKTTELIFNNQSAYIKTFNHFLSQNAQLKKEFFKMNKKDRDLNFKAIISSIIMEISLNETFKN